jgi:hypothetical protein
MLSTWMPNANVLQTMAGSLCVDGAGGRRLSIHTGRWTTNMSQHPVPPRWTAGTMPSAQTVVFVVLWWMLAPVGLAWFAGLAHGGLAVAVYGAAVVLVVAGWVGWTRRRVHDGDEVADLTSARATTLARQLRPSLVDVPDGQLRPADTGLAVGTLLLARGRRGPLLRVSWQDGVLAVLGPQAMSATGFAAPLILDAPGAVLVSSNCAAAWAVTHRMRAHAAAVWVFDPQAITRTGQRWWWNPLAGVHSMQDAARLASHFVRPMRREARDDGWLLAAEDLLASLFLAAALSGTGMAEVWSWLTGADVDEPVSLLSQHGCPEIAGALWDRHHKAPQTRDGTYATARAAASCLQDPGVMAWVNQPAGAGVPCFDAEAFPVSRGTLYLLADSGAGAAGPLVAAMIDQVTRAGMRRAEACGGRLDPPMLCLLDVAADACPVGDLPQLYRCSGQRGINLVTMVQNLRQATTGWQGHGTETLWNAATVKLIGRVPPRPHDPEHERGGAPVSEIATARRVP